MYTQSTLLIDLCAMVAMGRREEGVTGQVILTNYDLLGINSLAPRQLIKNFSYKWPGYKARRKIACRNP